MLALNNVLHQCARDWWARSDLASRKALSSTCSSCVEDRDLRLTGKKAVPHRTFVFSSRRHHSFCVCRTRLASAFLALEDPRRRRHSCLRPAERGTPLTSPYPTPFRLLQAPPKIPSTSDTDIHKKCTRERGGGGQPRVDWVHSRLGTPPHEKEVRGEGEGGPVTCVRDLQHLAD